MSASASYLFRHAAY